MKNTNLAQKWNESNIISFSGTKHRDQRDIYACKIDILDKIKKLPMLPGSEYTVVETVADYFDMSIPTLRTVISANKHELYADGLSMRSWNFFFLNWKDYIVGSNYNTFIYEVKGIPQFNVANGGRQVFTKKSVMRLAMLLSTSPVAEEIRNVLLGKSIRKAKADLEALYKNSETDPLILAVKKYKEQYDAEKMGNIKLRKEFRQLKSKYDTLYESVSGFITNVCEKIG